MNTNQKNVTLITGASSGIGFATALAAAQSGHTVIATIRNEASKEKLTKAAADLGVIVHTKLLEVTDHQAVTKCIDDIVKEFGSLHAVINNAGVGHVETIEHEEIDDVRAVMEVNFFSVVAVSKAALAYLRETSGKLITVTSVGGIIGQPFNEAYCASKFAVEGFMESLAPVAKSVGVSVTVVEPGAVASSFVDNLDIQPDEMIEKAGVYKDALAGYTKRVLGQFATNAQPVDEVAAVIVDLLDQKDIPFRVQTSDIARAMVGLKISDTDGSNVQSVTSNWLKTS